MDEDKQQSAEALRASLVKLASGHLEKGIIHEPRAFFDVVELNPVGHETAGHSEVFSNGEQFPIRLTHLTATLGLYTQEVQQPTIQDELLIQRVGMKLLFHNQAYMNPEFLPVPLWGNKVVATAPQVSFGTSGWHFDVPFVLSQRDSLVVSVQSVDENPPSAVVATVTFTGIGYVSGRPYILTGHRELLTGAETGLPTTSFRNDGGEPIIVTDMTTNLSSPIDDDSPVGDGRGLLLNVRQAGNGTNAQWFQGVVSTTPPIPNMQSTLLGVTSGRAVVHEFPGDGLIWEPGEGIDLRAQGLTANPPDAFLHVALLGYITVS